MTICPNEIKDVLRKKNWVHEMNEPSRCWGEAIERSTKFWEKYEQVNRDYCPDDPVYSIIRSGTALSTTADHLGFQASSTGQGRILEIIIGGEATSAAVNRVFINRAGIGFSGSVAITPVKFNTRSPNAAGTYAQNASQSLVGNPLIILAFNAFGGFIRWVAAPGEEMYYENSEVISIRSNSGTSTVSSTGIFEEL